MKSNVGSIDRIVRIVLGLAIIAAGLFFNTWLGALGVIFLATAAISWCPLYVPFGLSSCPTKASSN